MGNLKYRHRQDLNFALTTHVQLLCTHILQVQKKNKCTQSALLMSKITHTITVFSPPSLQKQRLYNFISTFYLTVENLIFINMLIPVFNYSNVIAEIIRFSPKSFDPTSEL